MTTDTESMNGPAKVASFTPGDSTLATLEQQFPVCRRFHARVTACIEPCRTYCMAHAKTAALREKAR